MSLKKRLININIKRMPYQPGDWTTGVQNVQRKSCFKDLETL